MKKETSIPAYESAMGREGLRLTPQRRQVYNCLETMVGSGLVKAVHVDREPTRFCANLREHGHFHCTECGHVSDIEFSQTQEQGWRLPSGFLVTQHDVTLRGLCAHCGAATKASHSKTKPSTK